MAAGKTILVAAKTVFAAAKTVLYKPVLKQNNKKTENNDKIGQFLVSRALDDTKTIGNASADMFANFVPGKP